MFFCCVKCQLFICEPGALENLAIWRHGSQFLWLATLSRACAACCERPLELSADSIWLHAGFGRSGA